MLHPMVMAAAIALTPVAGTNVGMAESCAVPNAPAVVTIAAVPDVPFAAQLQHATGTALVQLDIDAAGTILNASVARSSGDPLLDREAVATTQRSQFRPAISDCAPVGGTYIYEVAFPAD